MASIVPIDFKGAAAGLAVLAAACHVTHDPATAPPRVVQQADPRLAAPTDEDRDIAHELLALDAYERIYQDDTWDSEQSVAVIRDHPDTYGARMLTARLTSVAYNELAVAPLDTLIAFLDGSAPLAGDAFAALDLDRFRETHEDDVRSLVERRLLETGCAGMMGYCTWWVARYPERPSTQQFQAEMDEIWHRRIRPGWKGSYHHRCAYRCGTRCRAQARPLDDSCYAPCYARCL